MSADLLRDLLIQALRAVAPGLETGACGLNCVECHCCYGCATDPPWCQTHRAVRAAQGALRWPMGQLPAARQKQ